MIGSLSDQTGSHFTIFFPPGSDYEFLVLSPVHTGHLDRPQKTPLLPKELTRANVFKNDVF